MGKLPYPPHPVQWPPGQHLNWYKSALLQLVKIYSFTSAFKWSSISKTNLLFPSKGGPFHFNSWVHLMWARPVLIHTYYVEQLYPWAVYFTCISLVQSKALQMGSRICESPGMKVFAKPWNNNANINRRSQFLLPLLFCTRYNGWNADWQLM